MTTTTLAPHQQQELELLFTESLFVVRETVSKFCRKYGGDFEEFLSLAQSEIFIKAWTRFDGAVAWEAHIRTWVWYELLDRIRVPLRRKSRTYNNEIDSEQYSTKPATPFGEFVEDLSSDAAFVVKLITEGHNEIEETVAKRGGEFRNYKSVVREFLVAMRWDKARVSKAFQEISLALKG